MKVSKSGKFQKPTQIKLALMRTYTGKEDPELPLLQRINSVELTAPQITAQINVHRVQVTDTSRHKLFR